MWVRKVFQKQCGEYHLLMNGFRIYDNEYFFKYYRMRASKFEYLLVIITRYIIKSVTQ